MSSSATTTSCVAITPAGAAGAAEEETSALAFALAFFITVSPVAELEDEEEEALRAAALGPGSGFCASSLASSGGFLGSPGGGCITGFLGLLGFALALLFCPADFLKILLGSSVLGKMQ